MVCRLQCLDPKPEHLWQTGLNNKSFSKRYDDVIGFAADLFLSFSSHLVILSSVSFGDLIEEEVSLQCFGAGSLVVQ